MVLSITVPGKGFVVGEYIATTGGPCLIAALSPRFTLIAEENGSEGALMGIHPDSPAGKFYKQYQADFQNYKISFVDPHQGAGGWGASTAQFAALYALRAWRESIRVEAEKQLDMRHLLEEYHQYAYSGQGLKPSGADLVAQYRGGLCYFDRNNSQLKRYYWPFSDMGLAFIRTGNKLATHEHLQNLGAKDFSSLKPIVTGIQESLELVDASHFIQSVQNFYKALQEMGLQDHRSVDLVNDLMNRGLGLAAKGCGAMGVDTLLVVYRRTDLSALRDWVDEKGLELVATEKNFESGIDVTIEPSRMDQAELS